MGYKTCKPENEALLKSIKDLLKRKPKPDPTKPETMESETPVAAPAAPEVKEAAPEKEEGPGFFTRMRQKFTRKKKDTAPEIATVENADIVAKGGSDDISTLESVRNKLSNLVNSKNGKHTRNTVLIIAGGGLAIAGMAADVMFLGGMGTATVVAMVYSDWRNQQHIQRISSEINKIDVKIDELKGANQPLPEYGPALAGLKSSIEDFQASAKKVPPEVAKDLARLKGQVTALQEKISPPANDDRSVKPAAPAAGG